MKPVFFISIVFVLAACAAPRPAPDVFDAAEQSIRLAEAAGGDEFAPVEMRFA